MIATASSNVINSPVQHVRLTMRAKHYSDARPRFQSHTAAYVYLNLRAVCRIVAKQYAGTMDRSIFRDHSQPVPSMKAYCYPVVRYRWQSWQFAFSILLLFCGGCAPAEKSDTLDMASASIISEIPQLSPFKSADGFDGDEHTLFHSTHYETSGTVTVTFPRPVHLQGIEFVAQRDASGAGAPLLGRLPVHVSVLAEDPSVNAGAVLVPLRSPLVNAGRGTATIACPSGGIGARTFRLYMRSPTDYLTFGECVLKGTAADGRAAFGRWMAAAALAAVCTGFILLGSCRLGMPRLAARLVASLSCVAAVPSRMAAGLYAASVSPYTYVTTAIGIGCAALAFCILGLHVSGIDCTGIQSGDGLWFMATVKSMTQEPRWWLFPSLGAPLQADMRDFPLPDYLHMVIIHALTRLCGAVEPAFWLYYVGSFGLTYATAAFAYRRLGVSAWLLHVLACGYAFLPYHFIRLGHYCLSMYYTLPLAVLAATSMRPGTRPAAGDTADVSPASRSPPPAGLGPAGILACDAISAFGGAYYCIWYLLLLAYGVAFALVSPLPTRDRLRATGRYLLHAGITVLLFKVALLPFEAIRREQGPNPEGISHRLTLESDLYASSLALLITPSVQSTLAGLMGKTSFPPFATALPTGESVGAYVGVPATLGIFLACLAIMRCVQRGPRRPVGNEPGDEVLRFLAPLVLYLLLWTTFGGFNALFAHLVTPQIRCWNRLSVLLSFVAAGVFGLEMSKSITGLSSRWPREGRVLLIAVVGLILATCMAVTQLPPWTAAEVATKRRVLDAAAKEYFGEIAARPAHTGRPQVLILPYMGHPETAPPDKIDHYAYFLPFIHSEGVRWSFGGCRGRPAGEVYEMVATRPPAEMLAVARRLGYTGILICRPDAYAHLVRDVGEALGDEAPALSVDGHWAYFDLPGSNDPAGLSPQAALEIAAGDAP